MNNAVVMDTLGSAGAVLYLIAYLLISLKKLEGDSPAYPGMNIAAGILLVINIFLPAHLSLARLERGLDRHRTFYTRKKMDFKKC